MSLLPSFIGEVKVLAILLISYIFSHYCLVETSVLDVIKIFLKKDSSVGVMLMLATVVAMLFANTPLLFCTTLFSTLLLKYV